MSKLIRYFTCGPDEVRAWTIRKGTKAPQAAGVIQYVSRRPCSFQISCFPSSDFENKFVCGEIMSFSDLKEHGSEAAVKAAGKLRQQGKPYDSKHTYRILEGLANNSTSGRWRHCVLEIRCLTLDSSMHTEVFYDVSEYNSDFS